MRKKSSILVTTKPLTVSAVLQTFGAHSSTRQVYDNSTGVYSPNRLQQGTLLEPVVFFTDPNTGITGSSEESGANRLTITSVRYFEQKPDGTRRVINQIGNGYSIDGRHLAILKNVPEGESGTEIIAVISYQNPSTGATQVIEARESLTTAVSAVSALSLTVDAATNDATYAGRVCLINPIETPLNFQGTNWKRKCRVQLRDGTVPLADAHTIGSAADAARTGNAFYFWYYRQEGQLIRLLENNDWFEAEYYADGTMSREVTVNLAKIKEVELVCKAGYIPYGELADYVNGDGIIEPSKCYLGYLQETFNLHVALPVIQNIEIADIAHPRLEKAELGSNSVSIIRRALVTCGGKCVNDLSETAPYQSAVTWLETLFDITWYAVQRNGTETAIGNGEWLVITPSALGALSENSVPHIEVDIRPKYPVLFGNNYVEGYSASSSGVVPVVQYGNKGWLNNLDFYLLDTTDNTGEETTPLLLRRNNLLRFAGGGWAPVVHISAEQEADAQLELYTREGQTYIKYCEAGGYDPEQYWDLLKNYWSLKVNLANIMNYPNLYKSDGQGGYVKAHAKLPWETSETKWTIGIGYGFDVYLLDGVQGASGTVWKGLFTDITEWDGIDLTPFKLAPTAVSPCPVATITEGGKQKTRNLFFLTQGETYCAGSAGLGDVSQMFHENGRTYPRVYDVTAITNMNYARNNNSVVTSPVPFAEGGYHARNVMITAMELLYSRKNPFRAAQFGSGISSNDACSSLATWWENGGIRASAHGDSNYSYHQWSSQTPFYYNASAKRSNFSETLSNYYPKEQCMESQLAASFAVEMGISATTDATSPGWFLMYGGQYYYMNVSGAKTLSEGFMNARVYKYLEETVNAYDANGGAVQYDIEVILRMSLFGGLNLSGDIFDYCQGGAECIGTCQVLQETSRGGNKYDVFLITDQKHWVRDTNDALGAEGQALIEQSEHALSLGSYAQVASGYMKKRLSYSPVKLENGGDLSTYECCYGYTDNYWGNTVGHRWRVGLRFRGYAHNAFCSPRAWYANYAASHPYRTSGGSAQARIRKRS